MREHIGKIKSFGVTIYAVAPSNAKFIAQFLEAFGPFPFPIVGDPYKRAYRELGHLTMAKWKLLSMAAAGYLFGMVKNFIPKDKQQKQFVLHSMKTQDVYIQGGTWLFSDNGEVVWKHIDRSPQDHAKIDEILKKAKQHSIARDTDK